MACLLWIGSCGGSTTQEEKLFKNTVEELNQLIIQFEDIPDETTTQGHKATISKNRVRVKSFYATTAKEWNSIDDRLLELRNSELGSNWKLDAIFCRAVLHTKLVEITPSRELVLKTIQALEDYISNSVDKKLNKWTKNAMEDSVLKNYRKVFAPKFSDEENISIIFQMLKAFELMILKEYNEAIVIYETIVKKYPESYLVDSAKAQITTCKQLMIQGP